MRDRQVAHALSKVLRGPSVGDLHPTPRVVHVEEDKEIDCSIAAVLEVVALKLTGLGWDRLAGFADQLSWAFIETNNRALWVGHPGIEVEHILHAGNVFCINLGDAPHLLAPRLQVVFGQASAHGFA